MSVLGMLNRNQIYWSFFGSCKFHPLGEPMMAAQLLIPAYSFYIFFVVTFILKVQVSVLSRLQESVQD